MKDLNSLLRLIGERKRIHEQEEAECNMEILLDFLHLSHHRKQEEMQEVKISVQAKQAGVKLCIVELELLGNENIANHCNNVSVLVIKEQVSVLVLIKSGMLLLQECIDSSRCASKHNGELNAFEEFSEEFRPVGLKLDGCFSFNRYKAIFSFSKKT